MPSQGGYCRQKGPRVSVALNLQGVGQGTKYLLRPICRIQEASIITIANEREADMTTKAHVDKYHYHESK